MTESRDTHRWHVRCNQWKAVAIVSAFLLVWALIKLYQVT